MNEHLRANGIEKKGGVDEVLCGLREAGYQTAVVTATDEERTRSYLSEIGILDLFDDIVCATMVERGKPFPDVYEYACRKIGRKPEECAAVEDSPNGVRAASGAGCCVIMVPDLTQPDEELFRSLTGRQTHFVTFRRLSWNGTKRKSKVRNWRNTDGNISDYQRRYYKMQSGRHRQCCESIVAWRRRSGRRHPPGSGTGPPGRVPHPQWMQAR